MGDVLRIIDRFKITGHGVIYTVKISKGANVRMGDLLSDLRGNRFEVSGIEMFRRKIPEGRTFEDTLFPYTTLFRRSEERRVGKECHVVLDLPVLSMYPVIPKVHHSLSFNI